MAFERDELVELAAKILETVDAVKDGVGLDDLDESVGLLTAFGAAADELRGDTDAALLYLASALLGQIGDRRLDAAV